MNKIATYGYKPTTIAYWFLNATNYNGDFITHLKLQKLIYYAQSWMLACTTSLCSKKNSKLGHMGLCAALCMMNLKSSASRPSP